MLSSRCFARLGRVWLLLALAVRLAAEPPAGYYDGTEGLEGGPLQVALHEIIRDHQVIPYHSLFAPLRDLWADPDDAGRIRLTYSSASVPAFATWNREHLWPRSRGNVEQAGPDDSDLFHVVPTDVDVNEERGNRIFDWSATGDPSYRIPAHPLAPQVSADSNSWQPAPAERGDIARAMFYMAVRYNGSEPATTDLELVAYPPSGPQMGNLNALLQWHFEDPPDEAERARNDRIYTTYQGNRNPFIDDPDFATRIWGVGEPSGGVGEPLVRVAVLSSSASETPASDARLLIALNQFAGVGGLEVNFTLGGEADLFEYTLAGENLAFDSATGHGSVRVPENFATALLTLTPVADGLAEAPELVTLTLLPGPGYSYAADASSVGEVILRDGPSLPAAWTFNASPPYPNPLPASSGEGVIRFDGWRGTVNSFSGVDGSALALVGAAGNGSWLEVQISMTGYSDLGLEFWTRGTGTGYSTGTWSFSMDGTTFTVLPGVNTASRVTSFTRQVVSFLGYPELNNAPLVTLRYTLAGATSDAGNNRIDELVLSASPLVADDGPRLVAVGVVDALAKARAPRPARLVLQLDGLAPAGGLEVGFAVAGTATPGVDYSVVGAASFDAASGQGTVTFAPNATAAVLEFWPEDTLEPGEPPKTIVLSVREALDGAYLVDVGATAVATISNVDHDDFQYARALHGRTATDTADNRLATKQVGEPSHLSTLSTGGASVWWTWTAPATGEAMFSTAGSNFDTILSVYTGAAVNALTRRGSDDDSGPGVTSQLTLAVTADTTYRIAVDGYATASGVIELRVSMDAAPVVPEVSLDVFRGEARERDDLSAEVDLYLAPSPSVPITVMLRLSGTATPGVDYETSGTREGELVRLDLAAGTSIRTVFFTALTDDDPTEGTETIVLTLEGGVGYAASPGQEPVTLTILDDTIYPAAWLEAYPELRGPAAGLLEDPDADGWLNVWEYLLGGHPLAAEGGEPLAVGPLLLEDPLDGQIKAYGQVSYDRRLDTSAIDLVPESAGTLTPTAWQNDLILVSATPLPGGTLERRIYRTVQPLGEAPRFFRLRVDLPLGP